MKISILTPSLSSNGLGRAYLLAKILQKYHEVEIVGFTSGNGIWEPVAGDRSIIYKPVGIRGGLKVYRQIKKLINKIDGDVIYAHKPLLASFGIGIVKKFISKKPLVLDIDDWEMGFVKENLKNLSLVNRTRFLIRSVSRFYSSGSYWNKLLSEKFVRFADEITVSNNFLKEKFGGTIIPHGRNTEEFRPEKFNKNLLREKYKIEKNGKVVMFFGTPWAHKGIEELIESISLIKDQNILLVVVGLDSGRSYCQHLVKVGKKTIGNRFRVFGFQPFEKVPEFLAIADIVVIPQRRNFATIGQTPAKVFDAMAMAKPIIATNVGDLPEILEGCGWIVKPENPEELAEEIQYVLAHPDEAKEIGQRAREKCIKKYSWDAMEKILIPIFKKYEENNIKKNFID